MTKLTLSPKARTQMILRALLAPIFMIGLLFLVAGRGDYWQAWVYSIINMIVLALMGTLLTRYSELVEERLNPKEGMKGWDKLYFAVTTPLYIIALIVAGLDARFGWTKNMPLQAELPGYTEFAKETKFRLLPGVW
jgi:hypothetical protein